MKERGRGRHYSDRGGGACLLLGPLQENEKSKGQRIYRYLSKIVAQREGCFEDHVTEIYLKK